MVTLREKKCWQLFLYIAVEVEAAATRKKLTASSIIHYHRINILGWLTYGGKFGKFAEQQEEEENEARQVYLFINISSFFCLRELNCHGRASSSSRQRPSSWWGGVRKQRNETNYNLNSFHETLISCCC